MAKGTWGSLEPDGNTERGPRAAPSLIPSLIRSRIHIRFFAWGEELEARS